MMRAEMIDAAVFNVLRPHGLEMSANILRLFAQFPDAMSDRFIGEVRREFRELVRAEIVRGHQNRGETAR